MSEVLLKLHKIVQGREGDMCKLVKNGGIVGDEVVDAIWLLLTD